MLMLFIIMKEHVIIKPHNCIGCVFGQQWGSVAQRNKTYQAQVTHRMLVSRINSLLVLVFSFVDNKKNTEYYHTYPLRISYLTCFWLNIGKLNVLLCFKSAPTFSAFPKLVDYLRAKSVTCSILSKKLQNPIICSAPNSNRQS